jgi:hypothetical protein
MEYWNDGRLEWSGMEERRREQGRGDFGFGIAPALLNFPKGTLFNRAS